MNIANNLKKQFAAGIVCMTLPMSQALSADQAILVLDGSGSMWGQVGGVAKIDIARDVIGDLMLDWNKSVDLGITVYGHRRKGDCSDIEALRPVGAVAAAEVSAAVQAINPKGKTPLTDAVREAASAMRFEEDRATVILLSDGEETCGGDPCAMAKELDTAGVDLTIHVVGFDLSDDQTTNLRCMADNTGGKFLKADDAQQLNDAMREVKQVVAEKAVETPAPAPAPMKKKKRVVKKKTNTAATIVIPNVVNAQVNLCRPESSSDLPIDCNNSVDESWVAKLSKDQPSVKVKPGEYRFAIGTHASDLFTVAAGETKEFPLGVLNVANLTREDVDVCGLENPQMDDCKNSVHQGWAGNLSPQTPAFEVLPGTYRLRIGNHYSSALTVDANEVVDYAMAKIDISDPAVAKIAVCGFAEADYHDCKNSVHEGWVDTIEPGQTKVEVLPGEYRLKFGNHFSSLFQVAEGESYAFPMGAIEIPTLTTAKVRVCALEKPMPEDCSNTVHEGWVGNIEPENPTMELPPGQYRLKVGQHYSDPFEIEPGVIAEFPMGAISIVNVGDEKLRVCAQESGCNSTIEAGYVGELSSKVQMLELPPGTYKLSPKNSKNVAVEGIEGIEVGDGEEVEVEL